MAATIIQFPGAATRSPGTLRRGSKEWQDIASEVASVLAEAEAFALHAGHRWGTDPLSLTPHQQLVHLYIDALSFHERGQRGRADG